MTVDVSWRGCRVVLGRPWPNDSDPVVAVHLADGYAPMVTRGRVVAVSLTGDGWEYRLAFPGIADDDRARLLRLTRGSQRRPPDHEWLGPMSRPGYDDLDFVDGWVEAIFVSAVGGEAMRAIDEVEAVAGRGLRGDRYFAGRGFWSGEEECQVSLIEGEDLDCMSAEHGVTVADGQHRRNIVTRGLDLGDLERRRFTIGDAHFDFDQPRPPCRHIGALAGPAMTRALGGRRGGACVRVLRSGAIRVGDGIRLRDAIGPEGRAGAHVRRGGREREGDGGT